MTSGVFKGYFKIILKGNFIKSRKSDMKSIIENILYNMEKYARAYEYYLKFQRLAPNFSDKEVLGIFRDLEKRIQFSSK